MYTPIQLDKVRNFRYGMLAISRIEKVLKRPIGKIDFENLTMEETATIIWAGLVHEDASLDVLKVMLLIDEYSDIETAVKIMGEAFSEAFGKAEAKEVNNEVDYLSEVMDHIDQTREKRKND